MASTENCACTRLRPASPIFRRRADGPPRGPARRGPKTSYTDEELTVLIRAGLAASPFLGEAPRKVWARLRAQGIRTSTARVLRLMQQAGLLAPSRAQRVLGPQAHDGTFITDRPNQIGGTDATSTVTLADGAVTVFVAVDHCTLDGIGLHAATKATRFEALEPLRQGVRRQFGAVTAGIAAGLQIRHGHGSQYLSEDFQADLRLVGMTSSPAFVRAPEGNGVAKRFIRTLKEQVLWVRTFHTVEERRQALHEWLQIYNEPWRVGRHGFRRRPRCAAIPWRLKRRHERATGPSHPEHREAVESRGAHRVPSNDDRRPIRPRSRVQYDH